jgi:hypothetical protein
MMARSIPTLQPFDPAAVGATSLLPQGGINRTTITLTAAVMGLQDHGKERRWGVRASAYEVLPLGEIAGHISNAAYTGLVSRWSSVSAEAHAARHESKLLI